MIQVEDMREEDIDLLLSEVGFGHFGCSANDIPFVVPIHYAYERPYIYVYTTEGKKHEIIRQNPNVCLQVEKITNNEVWQSVVVNGTAEQLSDPAEREHAMKLITEVNPSLTPAIAIRWVDNWIKENREVIYRITPTFVSGRYSGKIGIAAAGARPV